MKIVFMGTPDFAAVALQTLIKAGHEVCAVYTQPPRPAKRGQRPQKSAVHQLADSHGLEVRTPPTFRDEATRTDFSALYADVAVVAAYGLLLPQAVLDAPIHGCLNIHASLLPRWRGAAPIHRAIEAGDPETGICIMQMEASLDTGPILLSKSMAIDPLDTTGSLHNRLAELGGQAIGEALTNLPHLTATPQPSEGVTYAAKIDKAETKIDWGQDAETIARKIRAFSPFPGAWLEAGEERIKVLGAQPGHSGLNHHGVELLRLQRAGKKPQDAADFLRGFPDFLDHL